MITIEKLNHLIDDTPLKGLFRVLDTMKINEKPHPFCVTGKHIKKYYLDTSAGPCGMRINPLTKEWSNKRETKKGIIDTCSLSFEEHTYEIMLIILIQSDIETTLKELEYSLEENKGYLDKIFKEHKITGFNLVEKSEKG